MRSRRIGLITLVLLLLLLGSMAWLTFAAVRQVRLNKVLSDAVWKGDATAVERLLDSGADVDTRIGQRWKGLNLIDLFKKRFANQKRYPTVLMIAAIKREADIVRLFVEHGADVNARETRHNWTPLHFATIGGDTIIVEILLDRGAEVNANDNDGQNALSGAVYSHSIATIRLLLDRGAAVNVRGKHGITVLMQAASYGGAGVVKTLLERGADVNARDDEGSTALMAAAIDGQTDSMRLLLGHGADVNIRDKKSGRNALGWAQKYKNTNCVTLLKQAGAKR